MLMTLSRIALGFLVGPVQAVVDELGRGLRRRHLARVQRERLDDDGAGLGRDLARLGLREPARVGQARVELPVVIELGQVGWRRDEERQIRTPLTRLPELHELHLVGALGELLVVLVQLVPVRELAVGPHLEAEELLRGWQSGLPRRLCLAAWGVDARGEQEKPGQDWDKADGTARSHRTLLLMGRRSTCAYRTSFGRSGEANGEFAPQRSQG